MFCLLCCIMRFPHPSEAGLLKTLPPGYAHLDEPRAALCLVGQLAAPLQSLWVFANMRRWAELCFVGSPVTEPEVLLETYKKYLIQQRRDLWITPSMLQPCHLWLQAEGPPHAVTVQGPIRVEQLLAAERQLSGFEGSIMDGCRKLPHHAWLHANSDSCVAQACNGRLRLPMSVPSFCLRCCMKNIGLSLLSVWSMIGPWSHGFWTA